MGSIERRAEILNVLCQRRYDTIGNLANEFEVCKRTIIRDIEILSLSEPIYTRQGRYGGGVYVIDGFSSSRMYMNENELSVLQKILNGIDLGNILKLDTDEHQILKNIIKKYTKPIHRKG